MALPALSPQAHANLIVKSIQKHLSDRVSKIEESFSFQPIWKTNADLQAILNCSTPEILELAYAAIANTPGLRHHLSWCYQHIFKMAVDFVHPTGNRLTLLGATLAFAENNVTPVPSAHPGSFLMSVTELRKAQAQLNEANKESDTVRYQLLPIVLGPDACDMNPMVLRSWMLKAYRALTQKEKTVLSFRSEFTSEEITAFPDTQTNILSYSALILRIEKPKEGGEFQADLKLNQDAGWQELTNLVTSYLFKRSLSLAPPDSNDNEQVATSISQIEFPIEPLIASFYRMATFSIVSSIWGMTPTVEAPKIDIVTLNKSKFVAVMGNPNEHPLLVEVPRVLPTHEDSLFNILDSANETFLTLTESTRQGE